jgi:hypothetical protein
MLFLQAVCVVWWDPFMAWLHGVDEWQEGLKANQKKSGYRAESMPFKLVLEMEKLRKLNPYTNPAFEQWRTCVAELTFEVGHHAHTPPCTHTTTPLLTNPNLPQRTQPPRRTSHSSPRPTTTLWVGPGPVA